MQTFLPFADFAKTASILDKIRLGNQRKEALQILQTLAIGPYQKAILQDYIDENPIWEPCSEKEFKYRKPGHVYRKTPWYNHPAVRMWKDYRGCLHRYLNDIIFEWTTIRNCEDSIIEQLEKIMHHIPTNKYIDPPFIGNEDFHRSHRSNLLRKNSSHYKPLFEPDLPDNLPYIWPV